MKNRSPLSDPDVQCNTCVYWVRSTNHQNTTGRLGQCRRMPPQIILTTHGARAMWPIVEFSEFCGEHTRVES
jgi:hypothetical protein